MGSHAQDNPQYVPTLVAMAKYQPPRFVMTGLMTGSDALLAVFQSQEGMFAQTLFRIQPLVVFLVVTAMMTQLRLQFTQNNVMTQIRFQAMDVALSVWLRQVINVLASLQLA